MADKPADAVGNYFDPGGQNDYDLWVQLQSQMAQEATQPKQQAPGSTTPTGGTGAAGEAVGQHRSFREIWDSVVDIGLDQVEAMERLGEVPRTWEDVIDRFGTVLGAITPGGGGPRPRFNPSVTRWPRMIYDTPHSPGNPEAIGAISFRLPDPQNPRNSTRINASSEEDLYDQVASNLQVPRETAEELVENLVVADPSSINYQTGAGRALTREQYDLLLDDPVEFYSQHGFSRPTKPSTYHNVRRALERQGLKIYKVHDQRGSTYIRFGPPGETYLDPRMIPTIRIPKDGHPATAHDPMEYGVLYDTGWKPAGNRTIDMNLAVDQWGRPYADIRVLEDALRERYHPGTTPRSRTKEERTAEERASEEAGRQLELPFDEPMRLGGPGTRPADSDPGVQNAMYVAKDAPGLTTEEKARLTEAQEAAESGESDIDIRRRTGWFRNESGNWRLEIDDSKSRLMFTPEKTDAETELPLSSVLEHEELYQKYPALKDVKIKFVKRSDTDDLGWVYTHAGDLSIYMNLSSQYMNTPSDIHSVLVHEIQHIIQRVSGELTVFNNIRDMIRNYEDRGVEREGMSVSDRLPYNKRDREELTPSIVQGFNRQEELKDLQKRHQNWSNKLLEAEQLEWPAEVRREK